MWVLFHKDQSPTRQKYLATKCCKKMDVRSIRLMSLPLPRTSRWWWIDFKELRSKIKFLNWTWLPPTLLSEGQVSFLAESLWARTVRIITSERYRWCRVRVGRQRNISTTILKWRILTNNGTTWEQRTRLSPQRFMPTPRVSPFRWSTLPSLFTPMPTCFSKKECSAISWTVWAIQKEVSTIAWLRYPPATKTDSWARYLASNSKPVEAITMMSYRHTE